MNHRSPGASEPGGHGSRYLASTLAAVVLTALVFAWAGQDRLVVRVLAVAPGAVAGSGLGRYAVRSRIRGVYLVGVLVLACSVCWGLPSEIPSGLDGWWGVVYGYFVLGFLVHLGGEVFRELIRRARTTEEETDWRRRRLTQAVLLGGILLVFVTMFVVSRR